MLFLRLVEPLVGVVIVLTFVTQILIPLIEGLPLFPIFRKEAKLDDLESDLNRSSYTYWRTRSIRKKAQKLHSTIQKETECPPSPTSTPKNDSTKSESSPSASSSDSPSSPSSSSSPPSAA